MDTWIAVIGILIYSVVHGTFYHNTLKLLIVMFDYMLMHVWESINIV